MSESASSNPASPLPLGRVWLPVGVLFVVWTVLALRLGHLGYWQRETLTTTSTGQREFGLEIAARPGEIRDRHGRVLASTVTVPSLYLNPSKIEDPWRIAVEVGRAVRRNPNHLLERLRAGRDKQFLWAKRRLTPEEVARVRALDLPPDCYGFRDEYLRKYPQGQLAAHVLGLRDIDGTGRGGIEQAFSDVLTGRPGQWTLIRDARGRVVEVLDDIALAPESGSDVVLTIDAVIQLRVERELDNLMREWRPNSACVIVMDPDSGEILALASAPTYDPNHPGSVRETAWTNTAIASIYEPGSTFKPIIVAWGLATGLLEQTDRFHCERGVYRMGPRTLHDHHPYGDLSLTDVLVKSSNIGMAKIGERLTNAELHAATDAFGFGRPTGIELPGELAGQVRPLADWTIYSTGSIPMGQELSVTPLQLITAHAALANGGRLIKPTLIRSVGENKATPSRTVATPVIDPEIARWIVSEPLREVIERGTGRRARLPNRSLFGKTGTAQKMAETGGYSHDHHIASFVCGAPADDPRVLVLVVVDDPSVGKTHYGGTVAAPTASRILDQTLDRIEPAR